MLSSLLALVLLSQASARTNPKQLDELGRQVDAAVREEKHAQAIAMLNKALAINPQWQSGWWRLATVLYDLEDYAAARPALERLIKLDPKPGAPWVLLGLCEFEMRDYGLALQHLQRGDSLGIPAELDLLAVARYHQALVLILAGKFDPAQVLLDGLVRKGENTDELVLAQGLTALRIPALPATLSYTFGDDRVEIIRRVGRIQSAVAQRQLKEAAESFKDLMKQSLPIPNLHLSFAAFLLQAGETKAAETELRAEIKLHPRSVEARLRLCALLQDEAPNDMVRVAAEAVELDPKSFKTHYHLGKLLYKLEKVQESVKELEIARNLDPSSAMVRFALMRAYRSLGKEAEARREGDVFKTLRAAEEEFRTTGRLPVSFFEAPPPSSAQKTTADN